MKNKAFTNYIYTTAYQIMLVILPIVTTPYVSRVLGVDNIGTASYVGTIVTYFVLFVQGGISIYGRREIAKCQHDIKTRSKLFWQLSIIKLISFCTVIFIFYLSLDLWNTQPTFLLISGISIVACLFDVSWLFQGMENFKLVTIRNFIVRIVGTVCIFLFVNSPEDLGIYLGISSVSELISQLSLWFCVRKYVTFTKIPFAGILTHLRFSWVMFIPTIFNSLYTKVDKLMLGLLTTEEQLGVYTQGERIIDLLFKIIGSMGLVYMPTIAKILTEKDGKKIVQTILSRNAYFVWNIGILLTCGISAISNTFTHVFFGPGYERVSIILIVLAPIIILLGFSDLFGGQYMIASGMQKQFNLSILVGALIDIVLNAFLISRFGALGASISTVFAEFSIMLYQYFSTKRFIHVGLRPKKYLLVAGIAMFSIVKIMDIYMHNTILTLLLQMLVGGIVYVSILAFNKDKLLLDTLYTLKQKLKKQ